MACVVTEACIQCNDTDCAAVCPVDAFREGANLLVIEPRDGIDGNLCVPECPVDATDPEHEGPAEQQTFIALNADLARSWPAIMRGMAAPADAEAGAEVQHKRQLLDRDPPR